MKYEIHQIHLTKEETDIINTDPKGHFALDKQVTRISFDMSEHSEVVKLAKHAIENKYYEHKANIEANSLEGVFRIGNQDMSTDENPNIEDIDGMYSVSVGDLIVSEEGKYVVASMGFAKIG